VLLSLATGRGADTSEARAACSFTPGPANAAASLDDRGELSYDLDGHTAPRPAPPRPAMRSLGLGQLAHVHAVARELSDAAVSFEPVEVPEHL
jgi:hypothetical protein